ncbi:MAG TPA: calcium-binding protein [Beijerinckiaceae bacterium]
MSVNSNLLRSPITPQLYDISALQHLYGAAEKNTGNDTYTFGNFSPVFSIWDTGGIDTLSAAGSSSGALLNLNDTAFSSIGYSQDYSPDFPAKNVSIARNVVIEKAIGSEQADIIIGNETKNELTGNGGNDLIFGDEVAARAVIPNNGTRGDFNFIDGFWELGKYQVAGVAAEDDDDQIDAGAGNDWVFAGDGADIVRGGAGNDFLDGGAKIDVAVYDDVSGTITARLLTPSDVPNGMAPNSSPVWEVSFTRNSGQEIDKLRDFELVRLGDGTQRVLIEGPLQGGDRTLLFDGGGSTADTLDFSAHDGPVYVGSASGKVGAEVFAGWSPTSQLGQWLWNVFVPSGDPTGEGLTDPTGLRFTNFERVTGSSGDDIMGLWWLNPGGALTPEQEQKWDEARAEEIPFGTRSPAEIGAALDARMELARQIPQNQQDVVIEGGDGDDVIVGTRTGVDKIYGGAGNDHLYAGGFTSEIHGGAETDYLEGGGFKSQLYGEGGADIFGLAGNTFVMDATAEDFVTWGSFHLTGGVQQWWMEAGWAYWTPMSGIMSAFPLGMADVMGAMTVLVDVPTMATVRYAVTEADQLVVQFARGRGGQAVINDYKVDLDTGAAPAHIVAFRQVTGHGSLEDLETFLNLALKAGYGGGTSGADPLVLDLDGDGLELTRRDAGAYFDVDRDGFAERTAWVKGDDGILARDLDGNGKIDDQGELFGDATTPGFTALAALDSNADGKISSADSAFGSLRVWRDLDGDGVTDAGELKTLAESGITEISLASAAPAIGTVRGSTIRAEAAFTRADGTTSKISDVVLQNNQTDSRYLGDTTVSAAAAALPNLKGFGNMTDLSVAMTNDATLLNQVSAFKGLAPTTSWTALRASAADILLRWAHVDGVAADPMAQGAFDTRRLAFLEKYFGYEMAPRENGQPSGINVAELVTSWNEVLDKAAIRLAAQGPLHAIFSDLPYNVGTDDFHAASPTTLTDAYRAAIAQLPATAPEALSAWTGSWGPALSAYTDALVRHDGIEIRTDFAVQSLVRALDGTTPALTLSDLVSGLGLTGVTVGTAGNDSLARSASGLQVYVGGAGNDTITGGGGQDVYVYGRGFGQDTIFDSEGPDSGDRVRLALYNASDVKIVREGIDLVIRVNGTTDRITVKDQFATPLVTMGGVPITPDKGIEEIQFADGTIYEAVDIAAATGLGTNGADTIDGTAFGDEIEGLKGDDLLRGGDAGDNYYYTRGDGNDTIQDVMANPLLAGADTLLLLGGVTAPDLRLTRDGRSDDLRIGFAWGGDSITVKGQFAYDATGFQTKISTDSRIEALFFDQGAAWSWLDLQANVIGAYTTAGDDLTYGFGTSDELYASAGNDTLVGLDGGDTYHFGLGSGHDTIHDQQQFPETFISGLLGYSWAADDTLVFGKGIRPSDVTFKRSGAAPDLTITIAGSDDVLTIKDQFVGVKLDLFDLLGIAWFNRVETFRFEDGTVLTWEDVLHSVTTGTAADESLYGAYYADTLDGKGGNDFLSGGDDGDTYLFGLGYGNDTIDDQQTNVLTQTADTVRFGAGIAVADVQFRRDGASKDLLVTLASGDTLRVQGQYDIIETGPFGTQAFHQIERFAWADGTVKTWAVLQREIIAAAKTAGDDLIVGTHFDDTIDGGAGADRLEGENGADTYVFGLGYGADVVRDNWTNILSGNGDAVAFGAGIAPQDIVIARVGANDVRLGLAGTTDSLTIEGQFVYSTINYRAYEIESFSFANGTTWTAADLRANYLVQAKTAGNDVIEGFWSDDTLDGGAGNDVLRGGDGSDVYRFAAGFGDDRIEESVGLVTYADADAVEFGAGITAANTILSRSGSDLVVTFNGSSDRLTVAGEFGHVAWFNGWQDVETFRFADGTAWSDADVRAKLLQQAKTAGNDTVTGFYTADLLDGGAGNDLLQGQGGGDTYVFGKGYGQDTIQEFAAIYEDQPDTVAFDASVTRPEVTFQIVGNDLRISIAGTADTLTILGHAASNPARIEFFRFADGTTLTAAEVAAGALQAQSTSGNDTIAGTNQDDVLDGGAGNDLLSGLFGEDTYVFGRGSGQDTIDENGNSTVFADSWIDKVSFKSGVAPADLGLSRSGNDLVVTIAGTTDRLTVKGQFAGTGPLNADRIERFFFADGTTLYGPDIDALVLKGQATAGADMMTGYDSPDIFDGLAGDDTMTGTQGADTYVFGRGSGQDVIDDNGNSSSDAASFPDEVSFKPDVAPADVAVSRSGDDLVLTIAGTTDRLTIKDQFYLTASWGNQDRVERFVFADGTTWTGADVDVRLLQAQATPGDDTIVAYDSADVLDGLGGNDTLSGRLAADTYVFGIGSGQDIVNDNGDSSSDAGSILDRISFKSGIGQSDIQLSKSGNDLVVAIAGTADRVTIKDQFWSTNSWGNGNRIERFVFADGATWTAAEIDVRLLQAQSTPGADTIVAYDSNDVLDGLAGNDTLSGRLAADTYVFGRGSGADVVDENGNSDFNAALVLDTIQFKADVAPTDLEFARAGNDLVIRITGTPDQLTIKDQFYSTISWGNGNRIERFVFADGTVWTATELDLRVLRAMSSAGDDSILAYNSADVLDGLAGNDTLSGGFGADTYVFGRGYGQDVIDEGIVTADSAAVDQVTFKTGVAPGDLRLTKSGNDLIVEIVGTTDRLTVKGHLASTDPGNPKLIEQFVFADGTVWTPDQIENRAYGGTGSSLATSGNDAVLGTAGADTLDGLAGDDTLAGRTGSDTYRIYQGGGNDRIWEEGSSPDSDRIQLVGLNPADVSFTRVGLDLFIKITATGETTLVRSHFLDNASGVEQVAFANGTVWDRVQIQAASVIEGTSAAETIAGTGLPDTIRGRGGADTLLGGDGGDVYIYASGDGSDVIREVGSSSNTDVLRFTDLNQADVAFARSTTDQKDLVITVAATGATITVDEHFNAPETGLEQVRFADNSTLDAAAIFNLAPTTFMGTSGNDTLNGDDNPNLLYGLAGDDSLRGSYGNDRLYGDIGNDTLDGGAGNDQLFGDAGNDFLYAADHDDTLAGGAGTDTLEGAMGVDTYVFNLGDGQDTVYDGGLFEIDTLRLGTGIAASDLVITRSGDNEILTIGSTTDKVILRDQFRVSWGGVDEVRFADGTVWNRATLEAQANNPPTAAADSAAVNEDATATGSVLANDTDPGDTLRVSAVAGQPVPTGGSVNIAGVYGTLTLNSNGSYSYSPNNAAAHDLLPNQVVSEAFTYTVSDTRNATASATLTFTITGIANTFTGTAGNDTLTGTAGGDTLDGQGGNDVLIGGMGGDALIGGTGVDTASYAGAPAGLTASLAAPAGNTGHAAGDTYSGIENLTGSAFADSLTGDANANALDGGAGNDTLNGGAGIDSMAGGAGDDVYFVDVAGDVVTEAAGAGTDLINTALTSYTLGAEVENLTFTGTAAFTGTGNTLNNQITGGSGADTLNGGAGNDTLNGGAGIDSLAGGAGDDTYVVDVAGDVVTEAASAGIDEVRTTLASYTLGTNVEKLTYAGAGNFTGTGNTLANELVGGAGNDTLNGGTGSDTMKGGAGNDVYTVDVATDVVTENANEGTDEIRTALTTYTLGANIEKLTFTGTAAFTGTGNTLDNTIVGAAGADTLSGGAGNDTLDGGAGIDRMSGGTGDDVYFVSVATDVIVENASEGTDEVRTALTSFTLGTNVENLTFTGTVAFTGTGNTLDNKIVGAAGADTLSGGAGNDTLDGGAGIDRMSGGTGDDVYFVSVATDVIVENASEGTDEVRTSLASFTLGTNVEYLSFTGTAAATGTGNTLDNRIVGNTGNDTLSGGAGLDTLTGGAGNDSLTGGAGSDTFTFAAGFGKDTVTDFTAGAATDDVIEFKQAVFANLQAVLASATQVGADVLITADPNNTLTLKSVALASLHADDFRFVA